MKEHQISMMNRMDRIMEVKVVNFFDLIRKITKKKTKSKTRQDIFELRL